MARTTSAAVPHHCGKGSRSASAKSRCIDPVYKVPAPRLNSKTRTFPIGEVPVKFVTLQRQGWNEPGMVFDDQVIGLRDAGVPDLLSLISGGADAMERVGRWVQAAPAGERFDPSTVKLPAPIPNPPKIVCIGLNYRDHAEESKMAIPEVPTVFSKYHTAFTGRMHPILLRKNSVKPDYEV